MKQTLSLVLSLVLLFSLSSCQSEKTGPRKAAGGLRTESGDVYPTSFLLFDGKEVEFDEFRYYYLNYKNMYLEEDPSYFDNEENETKLKEEVLTILLDSWAVRFLAEDENVKLTKSDRESVQSDIDKTVEFYEGKISFEESLEASFMSEELYSYMMEYSALYLKLFNELFEEDGKYAWTDEDFYAYYKEHYVAVQQIFLPYEEGEDTENHPSTLKKAEEIREKAAGGEDFWSLIEEHGKDDNMLSYPDGYYFTEGEAEDVLYKASAALEISQISQPVAASEGLYIIKRMEPKALRMDENRETTLFGYTDSLGEWHAGAYDDEFINLYKKRAETIRVEYGDHWESVSTETVF